MGVQTYKVQNKKCVLFKAPKFGVISYGGGGKENKGVAILGHVSPPGGPREMPHRPPGCVGEAQREGHLGARQLNEGWKDLKENV